MDNQLKQIAERLQGLRQALELTPEEMANTAEIFVEEYLLAERGESDIL